MYDGNNARYTQLIIVLVNLISAVCDIQALTRLLCCSRRLIQRFSNYTRKMPIKRAAVSYYTRRRDTRNSHTHTHSCSTFAYVRTRNYFNRETEKKEKLNFNHKYPAHLWDWSFHHVRAGTYTRMKFVQTHAYRHSL